jgi:hypothetical protein
MATQGSSSVGMAKQLKESSEQGDPVAQLEHFLQYHGAFPDRHRSHAWRIVLSLPRNEEAFNTISVAPIASLPLWMQERQESIFRPCGGSEAATDGKLLLMTLRRLASWNPPLVEMTYLPSLLSPFQYVFGDDEVLLFEVCVCFFLSWGESYVTGPWMEGVLEKPRYLLEHAWMLLAAVDEELFACFQSSKFGDARYQIIWPMLQTLFFDCLPRPAWLVLWDHLIVLWREPHLLAVAAVAILRCLRNVLLKSSSDTVRDTLKHAQVIPIPRLLKEFYSLRERGASIGQTLTHKSIQKLISPGAYPVFPYELNAVLDYLVRDRSQSRSQIESFRDACRESEQKYKAIEKLLGEEAKAREERAVQLDAEEACRSLNLKEDIELEREQERQSNALLTTRLDRLYSASKSVLDMQEQQQKLHHAECARLADEEARQRRRASRENETWVREMELSSTEAWAVQQLSEIARHNRVEEASRELRQKVHAEMLKRDREDEVVRQSQKRQDENDRACMRMDVERQLEAYQWDLADFRKKEMQAQLQIDDYHRNLQLGEVARERAIRSAAHEARVSGALNLQLLRRKLSKEEQSLAEAQAMAISRQRHRQEERLQKQWDDASDVRKRTCKSFERQEARLHSSGLAEEQGWFELRLQQAVESSEAVNREREADLRRELADIEDVRQQTQRAEALDARRRELLVRRSVLQQCSQRVASEILGEDRSRFACSIDVGHLISASESTDTNSEME